MKSFSLAKLVTLGCFALLLPVACGDDDDDNGGPSGGSAGTAGQAGEAAGGTTGEGGVPAVMVPGTGTESETIECGGDDCSSTPTILKTLFIDPCCTAAGDMCGVDSGFLTLLGVDLKGACLPKDQPGELDSACPDSPAQSVPFNGAMVGVKPFKGCCRAATNTCGFVANAIETDLLGKFTEPHLGCVDSAAFTGKPGGACGAGVGGAGGTGAGGMSTDGGAPVAGGAGGAGGAP
jgi:hypothetical protein